MGIIVGGVSIRRPDLTRVRVRREKWNALNRCRNESDVIRTCHTGPIIVNFLVPWVEQAFPRVGRNEHVFLPVEVRPISNNYDNYDYTRRAGRSLPFRQRRATCNTLVARIFDRLSESCRLV